MPYRSLCEEFLSIDFEMPVVSWSDALCNIGITDRKSIQYHSAETGAFSDTGLVACSSDFNFQIVEILVSHTYGPPQINSSIFNCHGALNDSFGL